MQSDWQHIPVENHLAGRGKGCSRQLLAGVHLPGSAASVSTAMSGKPLN
jgi:hypothetical protein